MSLNPLSIFYSIPRWELSPAGYIHISWRCDPDAVRQICRAGNFEISGTSLIDLQAVNTEIERLVLADRQLTTIVVDRLYRSAAAAPTLARNNCWFNFITAMTFRAALHTWRKVPPPRQSEELFERLVAPVLNVGQLFSRFNPEYHPHLLVGLQAWTYRVVAYNSFAYLRKNGDPYFGLSSLGIVSRSSWVTIRTALLGNIISTQIGSYTAICKIFKTYLERSNIPVNRLELAHWQEILTEIHLSSIDLTVAELRSTIDRIGSLIRAQSSPIIEKYDDPSLFIAIDTHHDFSEPDPLESDEALDQIFGIIEQFISSLPAQSQQILTLRHRQRLKQGNIADLMSIDQSQISRHLGKIYQKLLSTIHAQIAHPDRKKPHKNSQAIAASKHLVEKYFHRK
jgi:RNA polymerase sigma factor (sigma-70 family)